MSYSSVARVRQLNQLSRLFLFLLQSSLSTNAMLNRWPSFEAVQSRLPGCCALLGSFDCGDGVCLPISQFHDGTSHCSDGSDEYCFPEQIPCGTFCADFTHLGECLVSPNCDESVGQPSLAPASLCLLKKRRLCGLPNTVSCRGYGQCIFEKWLKDGKKDCMDGSDEDDKYSSLFLNNTSSVRAVPLPTVPAPLFSVPFAPAAAVSAPAPASPAPLPNFVPPPHPSKFVLPVPLTLPPPFVSVPSSISSPVPPSPSLAQSAEIGAHGSLTFDSFGTEFGRFMPMASPVGRMVPTVHSTRAHSPQAEAVLGGEKSMAKWIIFPNWPTSTATSKDISISEWPKGKAVEGGKKEEGRWSGGKKEEKWERMRGEKTREELEEEQLKPEQNWLMPLPNGGAKDGQKTAGEGTMAKEKQNEEMRGTPQGVQTESTASAETTRETLSPWWKTPSSTATPPQTAQLAPASSPILASSFTSSSASTWSQHTMPTPSPRSPPSPNMLPSGAVPDHQLFALPVSPIRRWFSPVSSHAIANVAEKFGALGCTERIQHIINELQSVPVQCVCPAGQFQTSDGSCALATVSTFRAKIGPICGHNFADLFLPSSAPSFPSSSPQQQLLIVLKLIDALPDQPFCVRDLAKDGGQIVLSTVCADECAIQTLEHATKSHGSLAEVNVKVSELADGPCHPSELNNCDQKAQCLPEGLRFRCRCLPGTKDTSPEGQGHRCEGTVNLQNCTKLLGVCLLVWLLMLLLLCFLLPILSLLFLKYCFKIDPALLRVRIGRILQNLKNKLKGRKTPPGVPKIKTTQIDEERRESVKPTVKGQRDETVTLKVPSATNGLCQVPIHAPVHLIPSDSEEYLIVEEEEEGGDQRGKDTAKGRETAKEEQTHEGVAKSTVTSSTETEMVAVPTAGVRCESLPSTDTKSGEVVEETTEVEVHEQTETVEEEKEGTTEIEGPEERAEERPKSAASRTDTPTIWDQYKILGDQFAKYGSLETERRKSSVTESLEELLRTREGAKSVGERGREGAISGRRETAEKREQEEGKEEMGRGGKKGAEATAWAHGEKLLLKDLEEEGTSQTEGTEEEGEEGKQPETGRAIPADTVREAASLNIGFVMPSQMGGTKKVSERETQQAVTFKRRTFGNGRLFAKKATTGQSVTNSSKRTFVRKPIRGGTEFVVVKGPTEERKDGWKRSRSVMGQQRRDAFVSGQLGGDQGRGGESGGKREGGRVRGGQTPKKSAESETKMPPKMMPTLPLFDPDLPSTSQWMPFWEESVRRPFPPSEGFSLRLIEQRMEERIHSGCITDREPWNTSPIPDPDLPTSPLREMTDLSEGSLARTVELLEERVHSGCITWRKPWDSSPHKNSEVPKAEGMPFGGEKHRESPLKRRKTGREGRTVRIQLENDEERRRERTAATSNSRNRSGTKGKEDNRKWLEYD